MATSTDIDELGRHARQASRHLALASSATKDAALRAAAELLVARAGEVLEANEADVERAEAGGVSPTVVDRLRLSTARVGAMAAGLEKVASLPDPVGEVLDGWARPNGLRIQRVRVPLGVVGVIYENRPNVTSDAAGLCVKSGNAALLRGSSAALHSNRAIVAALDGAFTKAGLPEGAVGLLGDTSHASAVAFMRLRGVIDCLVPRGGPGLIQAVLENATVPYVIDGDGNCHVYVDQSADLGMAVAIVRNAKMQRPSVCNAAESLVVHAAVADRFLPLVAEALDGVELVGDDRTRAVLPSVAPASESDFATEFLDLKMSVAVVASLDAAIDHVNRYGSGHTEA
ncbi:MAG: glutamate-5-semialdehyde dehydrogenase, partial [Acidimicrobiales bacterium]